MKTDKGFRKLLEKEEHSNGTLSSNPITQMEGRPMY